MDAFSLRPSPKTPVMSSPAQGRNDRRFLRPPAEIGSLSVEQMLPQPNQDHISSHQKTSHKHTRPLALLPPLRPSRRTVSYGGNQNQDPENDDTSYKFLRHRFASLLELRPTKRPRNNPAPPPPPPPQRRPANRTNGNAQAARYFRKVLRAPAVDEDAVTTAPVEATVPVQDIKGIFPLLNLPFEVREKILRHLLVSEKPVYVRRLWTEKVRSTRRSTRRRGHCGRSESMSEHIINTAILRTCRQMLAEGTLLLYSQNQLVYLLRDPVHAEVDFAAMIAEAQQKSPKEAVGHGKRRRKSDSQVSAGSYGLYQINIAKYGHMLRHLSIELEPTRTGQEYRELMEKALDVLASFDRRGQYLLAGQVVDGKTPRIFLHTLNITISPENDKNQRKRRSPKSSPTNNQETVAPYSSSIELFSGKSSIMHALCRIDTHFMRINMHIDEDALAEDEDEFAVNTDSGKRHLETTLDLRFLSRHVKQFEKSDNGASF